jgi:hypothetical protein
MRRCDHKFIDTKFCVKCGLRLDQIQADVPSERAFEAADRIVKMHDPIGSTLGRTFMIERLRFDIAAALDKAWREESETDD